MGKSDSDILCRLEYQSDNSFSDGPKAVILEIKELFGIVEWLFSPSRDNRLYLRKCHSCGYGATGGFCPKRRGEQNARRRFGVDIKGG